MRPMSRRLASTNARRAVHFWLYSRQPCDDPMCEDCAPVSTAELRQTALKQLIRQFSEESDYYHTPTDSNAAWA